MFAKVVTVVFYVGIALWAFHIAFPFLMPIIGFCAVVLAVLSAL